MPTIIRCPAIDLAQFVGDSAPRPRERGVDAEKKNAFRGPRRPSAFSAVRAAARAFKLAAFVSPREPRGIP